MKLYFGFMVIAVLVFMAIIPAKANTEIDVSGQVRIRTERDKRPFSRYYGSAGHTFTEMRTRVGIMADVESNTHIFIQFQDSRMFGKSSSGRYTSGTLEKGVNVDLHQAYIEVDEIGIDNFGLKAGRFKVNFGNQRVFGSEEWDNVSRA